MSPHDLGSNRALGQRPKPVHSSSHAWYILDEQAVTTSNVKLSAILSKTSISTVQQHGSRAGTNFELGKISEVDVIKLRCRIWAALHIGFGIGWR